MEVGDRLANLETGHCHYQDVVVEDPPVSQSETPVSPSLSTVGAKGIEKSEPAVENITPLLVPVCGQRAHWAIHFRVDPSIASNQEGGGGGPSRVATRQGRAS